MAGTTLKVSKSELLTKLKAKYTKDKKDYDVKLKEYEDSKKVYDKWNKDQQEFRTISRPEAKKLTLKILESNNASDWFVQSNGNNPYIYLYLNKVSPAPKLSPQPSLSTVESLRKQIELLQIAKGDVILISTNSEWMAFL